MILDREWKLLNRSTEEEPNLSDSLNISSVLAEILSSRGLNSKQKVENFLEVELDGLHSPFLLEGIEQAVDRISTAMESQEIIGIYGDYDVDGITSTGLLINYFQHLGVEPKYHIPNRLEEGYGLNKDAIESLAQSGVELLITVDCGISDYQEVKYANQLGIDVIITDHHEVPARIPPAEAVINAKQSNCNYPFSQLCGAGVAYKLILALADKDQQVNQKEIKEYYLDLLAMGIVADIVPLVDENRIMVKYGLELLQNPNNLGLSALIEAVDLTETEINTGHIGYILAPRLNAAGRIGNPDLALELLITDDPSQAADIAAELEEINHRRRDIEADIRQEAELMVEGMDLEQTKALVLASENWHSGVVGIVASDIQEKYYRPTIMIAIEDDGIGRGSARSIKGFNIYQAVKNSEDLLPKFGGHEQAAGLSIAKEDIAQFRDEINQYADDRLSDKDLTPRLKLDCEVELSELSKELVQEIDYLAPFGFGNPRPKLAVREVTVADFATVGSNGEHLKLAVTDEAGTTVECIGFNMAGFRQKLISQQEEIDLACTVEINNWQGKSELQLKLKDINFPEVSFIDQLFAKSKEIIADNYYRGIGEEDQFYTKVVGVTFEGRQELIKELKRGDKLNLVREPENEYDESAIRVETTDQEQIGYLKSGLAKHLAPYLDVGFEYQVTVSEVTGGVDKNLGVNIFIEQAGYKEAESAEEAKSCRAQLETLNRSEILNEVRQALIGDYDFRSKQKEVLTTLDNDQDTLAIFGTGRGKSAIFQSYAALQALNQGRITVILYPLRALVNDQFDSLKKNLAPLGLDIYKANGSLSVGEREKLITALNHGELDIVLTTPEFMEYHLDKFQNLADEIGFLVVDESHHIGMASSSFRPTYKRLGKLNSKLGNPLVLAVTATANNQVAREIIETLNIGEIIIDPHVRSNLEIIDKRGCRDKEAYLYEVASSGEKSIIYVNSREQSIELASNLRQRLPGLAEEIGFYNAGLTNKERNRIESMFWSGKLKIIVSTSAFGEGIDIPDIRNIVLYHLNFNLTEFNQQSGRVGRDGKQAKIHLLFGQQDVRINEFILDSMAPEREVLVQLYCVLKQEEDTDQQIKLTNQQLAQKVSSRLQGKVRENTVSAGLGVLEDLNILTRIQEAGNRIIQLRRIPDSQLDLNDSLRYREGLEDKEAFNEFKDFILNAEAEELLSLVNQPIYPTKLVKTKGEN
ncbi:single-stranded-DNA-specific exonuclease RecJ [Acetohalobium arabaticum]|uniref:Single-stranded-DNA-specific exonuclease RecJ n=1 Tax=Acetohalobium arabaticum (strain ATCC 49924 / DSM 5501 / Z-7288) TaxID=574087 RepID=D9QVJ7_ACEAZ|nr:single-stranded-DNA-specific exonuclease RecJ [Acetohalobium arabaticum]ADL12256.1 single-stranded-DNA-specific exonuclease RecJ [Acetohalobium arabaticum DSM 5501]